MGYISDSFTNDNRLDSDFRDDEPDFFRPETPSSSSYSVEFYSPFFLQRQAGNTFSFVENFADKAAKMDTTQNSIVPDDNQSDFSSYDDIPSTISLVRPENGLRNVIQNTTTTINQFFENLINQTAEIGNVTSKNGELLDINYDSSTEVLQTILNNKTATVLVQNHAFGKLDAPEYAVFGGILLLSSLIGIFYGCCAKGQKSTADYLIANRQLNTIPAALSLLCSFISAITILGNPLEIYFYGSSYSLIVVTFIPLTLTLAFFFCPVFFNLQLTSAYEVMKFDTIFYICK